MRILHGVSKEGRIVSEGCRAEDYEGNVPAHTSRHHTYERRFGYSLMYLLRNSVAYKYRIFQVGQGGIEPPTPAFSGLRSTD
jgi:hypothetical protein